jgi:hypothetical protein
MALAEWHRLPLVYLLALDQPPIVLPEPDFLYR